MKTLIFSGAIMVLFVLSANAQDCPAYMCKSASDICYKELQQINPKITQSDPSHAKWRVNICEIYDSSTGELSCSSGKKISLHYSSGNLVDGEYIVCDDYAQEAEFQKSIADLNKEIKTAQENPQTQDPGEDNPVTSAKPTPTPAPSQSEEEKNGECGIVTAAEAGLEGKEINSGGSVRKVKGSWRINSCSVYDSESKSFKCSPGKTVEILDGEDVYTTLFCDRAEDKEGLDFIIQKLNEMKGAASFNPYGDLRDFVIMKECSEETDETRRKAGRCYSDKVEDVADYEQLMTLMTVTLLGYKLPLVCENAAQQADIVNFQGASYNYLNAEQMAYNNYMFLLERIKAFEGDMWPLVVDPILERHAEQKKEAGDNEAHPYWGYFLSETEEKVKASMTGTGDMCETVEVGDQLKALLQLKLNYLAMADLVEAKIENYNAIAAAIYDSAAVSHAMAASLDAAWDSCSSAATATAAGCAAMVATGVALSANPKTRPLGMILIALGTYGLITVAGLSGAADDLESALKSGGDGNTPSKSSYGPVTSALADVKKYGDRTLACGSLKACSSASDKEKETLVTCDPTKMTCAALGVGAEMAPGEVESYKSSTERFSKDTAMKAQEQMKTVARYLVNNLDPSMLGKVLGLLEMRLLVNKVYAASRTQPVTSETVNNNVATAESREFQKEYKAVIEDLKSRLELLNANYEAKQRYSMSNGLINGNKVTVGAEETKAYEERKAYIKTLNEELARLNASLTVKQLQDSVAKVQEIQEKTDAEALAGASSTMPIAIPVAGNDSPIECDYLPASKFSSCWKDASFSRPPSEVRTTKSINLCHFYNKEHERFDFCLAGQTTTKVARFDVLRSYTDVNGQSQTRKVTYYKNVDVACYNLTGNAANSYTTGTNEKGEGTASLAGGGHPTMEQAWHMEEMSCVINAMNEELSKLPKEEVAPAEDTTPKTVTEAKSSSGAFNSIALQANGSFNCGEACGDSKKGDELKSAFGLWDDAVYMLRGDNGYEPLLYSAAVAADKGILSPRYRAVLFETIAKEINSISVVLGGEGGMLRSIQSNITNVTKLLRDTELKTVKLDNDVCAESVGKASVVEGDGEDNALGTQVISKRPPGSACPTGKSSNGICSTSATADKLTSNTLKSGALTGGGKIGGPKLSSSVLSGINSRVSLTTQTSSTFASLKYNVSDARSNITKAAANLENARRDLSQMKAFRKELDKVNGVRATNYDSFVKKSSEKMSDIFASSQGGASQGEDSSSGSGLQVASVAAARNSEKSLNDAPSDFLTDFTPSEVPSVSLPSLDKRKVAPPQMTPALPRTPAQVDKASKLDYARYGKKEEDMSFEAKIHGSRDSLFDVISKRYIRTGLDRVNYVEL